MERSEYVRRLDERLDTHAYADVDASANGLQVGTADGEVSHVAFAVDAALETIREAATAGADLLVTHHGLSWGGIERVTGRTYDRIAALADAGMGLYVSHLPLDGHADLGNAAGVVDELQLTDDGPFGSMGSVTIGRLATAAAPTTAEELRERLDGFEGRVSDTKVLQFGPDRIERVAVVTGSGVDWLDEAVAADADALITGEGKQQVYHDAREAGISVFLAGHYATETFGVRALQTLSEGWGLDTTYVSHPTGL